MRFVRLTLLISLFFLLTVSSLAVDNQYPKAPLNDRVVAALVVGGSLPESVAADVLDYGVTFHPDQQYLNRLQKSGAAPIVLDALRHVKVPKNATGTQLTTDSAVLNSILTAGEKLQSNKIMDAAKEITSSHVNLEDYPELAFVMGEIISIESGPAQSVAIYEKLADLAPEFPEVHTKLSFAVYKLDDYERGLHEAMSALARTPPNAEAHKNKALSLEGMGNYDAAIAEYQQALALKPDYEKVHYDLGLLYYHRKDYRNSIEQYRKALTLDPADGNAHYNLALAYEQVHERGSAIEQCRDLIHLDPKRMDARMELAELLVRAGQKDAGISEFRQLISLSPDSSYCHLCFARLLFLANQFDEAEKEYKTAIALDPTDGNAHVGLGRIYWLTKKPDDAIREYLQATKLGRDDGYVHRQIGAIYLGENRFSDATRELKVAVSEAPEDSGGHFLLAEALEKEGQNDEAIAEYREMITLVGISNPESAAAQHGLAALLEKSGYPADALKAYQQLYISAPNEQSKADYESARKRLSAYDQDANQQSARATSGSSSQNSPQPTVSTAGAQADVEADKLPALFQEKTNAMQVAMADRHWNEAQELGNAALNIAEKMVPQDERLSTAHRNLGMMYMMERKFSEAEKEYFRDLQVSQELSGKKSRNFAGSLTDLGLLYIQEQKFPQAIEYLMRSIAVFDSVDPASSSTAFDYLGLAYDQQGDFKNAEVSYKKMLAALEASDGPGSYSTSAALERLAFLNFEHHNYAEAQGLYERLLAIEEKKFGANSTMIRNTLDRLASTLRAMGKNDEAEALERRKELIAQNQTH